MSDEERFERAIEKVLADRSPRIEVAGLSPEEQRMVRRAQLLRGSRVVEMSPEFVERLGAGLFPQRVISRRRAFVSGLGALTAGIAAVGIGLDRTAQIVSSLPQGSLVGVNGRWYPIKTRTDLSDGTIRPFTAGAVQRFLMYRDGQLRALSRICTHMGRTPRLNRSEGTFA